MRPPSQSLLLLAVIVPLGLIAYSWSLVRKRPKLVTTLGSPPFSLAVSPDGSMLAVQQHDGTLGIWKANEGRYALLPMEDGPALKGNPISSGQICFLPDNRTLAAWNIPLRSTSTAICSGLYTWDTQKRKIKWSVVSNAKDDLSQFWMSPDGKRVVQCSYYVLKALDTSQQGTVRKTQLSKFARTFPTLSRSSGFISNATGGDESLSDLAFSPDGRTFALTIADGHIEFRSLATGKKQSQTPPSSGRVEGGWKLRYSPDGRFVALLKPNLLSLWDTKTRQWTTTPVQGYSLGASLAWMPDSHSLWASAKSIHQWSVPDLKVMRTLPVDGPLAISNNGKYLFTRNIPNNGVWRWDMS